MRGHSAAEAFGTNKDYQPVFSRPYDEECISHVSTCSRVMNKNKIKEEEYTN